MNLPQLTKPAKLVVGALLLGLLLLLALTALSPRPPATAQRPLVVASFYPFYFFASQIVGPDGAVKLVIPAGVEPHDYEPEPARIAAAEQADVFLYNGAGLEPWAARVTDNLPNASLTLEASQGLANGSDPHIWLEPHLMQGVADRIADAVARANPRAAPAYRERAARLKERLATLDARLSEGLRDCRLRTFLTSHAAFAYFSRRYGLEQLAIAGLDPEAEPTPGKLRELSQLAREKGIRYVFFESLMSPRVSQSVATEVGAQTLVLDPLEGLTPEEQARGEDYFTIMEANLKNLRMALECR